MSHQEWIDLEEKLKSIGLSLGPEGLQNIGYLRLIEDIGRKKEAGEISEEVARKAAMALWEMIQNKG